MSHFAQIDGNDVVTQIIVADQNFINSGLVGDPNTWIQTSPNTIGGVHYGEDWQPTDNPPLRKNYAGIGYKYDRQRDAFIPPKVYFSWILNEETCLWESPVPYPNDGKNYSWDEETKSWVEVISKIKV